MDVRDLAGVKIPFRVRASRGDPRYDELVIVDAMEFNQPNTGDLELVVGTGETQTSVRGPTLWHLLLAKPDLCREHLVPLLENLRPGWGLARMAEQIEDTLCKVAQAQRVPDRARVTAWPMFFLLPTREAINYF